MVASVWTTYFLSVSIRTYLARLFSVLCRNLGMGNGEWSRKGVNLRDMGIRLAYNYINMHVCTVGQNH